VSKSNVALAILFLALQFQSTGIAVAASNATTSGKHDSGAAARGSVFRLDVRRVPVDIVVTDKQGNPVRGLKKSDFMVSEDKKEQKILSFDYVDGSASRFVPPKLPQLPANTYVNLPSGPEQGPLYVLYFDMVNMDQVDQMAFHQQLLEFVDHAQPGARFALFVNARGLHLVQGFTSDHALLKAALNNSNGPGPHVPKVFIYGNLFGGEDVGAALSNLKFIADYLGGLPGRKNLLWMSSEFPIPVGPKMIGSPSNPRDMLDLSELESGAIKLTYAAMMRSQVALYPLDVRGVVADYDSADAMVNYDYDEMIAQATGGKAFYSDNKVKNSIDKAVAHGENYYSLTYAPSNTSYDGTERHISIALAKKGDYTVSYRRLYYALPDNAEPQKHKMDFLQARFIAAKEADTLYANIEHGAPMLHDLLFTAHLSAQGTPEMATAEQMTQLEDSPVYFRTRQKNKTRKPLKPVKMQKYVIDYGVVDRQLKALVGKSGNPAKLEFAAAAYDSDGRLLNSILNEGLISALSDSSAKPAAAFHAVQELEAPPGAAWIRLAVRDTATDRTGTLEVPLPLKQDLAKAESGVR
jgi:VWFA-related protein